MKDPRLLNIISKLSRPSLPISNGILDELHEYVSHLREIRHDAIMIVNMEELMPVHDVSEIPIIMTLFEYMIYVDNNSVTLTPNKILMNLNKRIPVNDRTIQLTQFLINNFMKLKISYNVNNGSVLLGYSVETNSAYFWKFL